MNGRSEWLFGKGGCSENIVNVVHCRDYSCQIQGRAREVKCCILKDLREEKKDESVSHKLL